MFDNSEFNDKRIAAVKVLIKQTREYAVAMGEVASFTLENLFIIDHPEGPALTDSDKVERQRLVDAIAAELTVDDVEGIVFTFSESDPMMENLTVYFDGEAYERKVY